MLCRNSPWTLVWLMLVCGRDLVESGSFLASFLRSAVAAIVRKGQDSFFGCCQLFQALISHNVFFFHIEPFLAQYVLPNI